MGKTCSGCGIHLQNLEPKALGYVVDLEKDLCRDCFFLKHYNKVENVDIHKGNLPSIDESSLILYVLSVNHLTLRFKYALNRFYPNSDIILVLNHIDTLMPSVKLNRLIHELKKDAARLNITIKEVIPVSALKNQYVDILIETVKQYQKNRNIYLVGYQNSGKSLLFRRFAEYMGIKTDVLSGKKPGLTREDFTLPFMGKTLKDTPGVYLDGSLASFLNYEAYQAYLIDQPVKPRIYQLEPKQSVIVGNLVSFNYIGNDFQGIPFYMMPSVTLHRTKMLDIENKFYPYPEKTYGILKEAFHTVKYKIKTNEKVEFRLAELGFIHIKGPALVEIISPKAMSIETNEALY